MNRISMVILRPGAPWRCLNKFRFPAVSGWFAFAMLLVLAGMLTSGRADTLGDFSYTTDSASATITGYTGPGGDVVIPDTILNKPVFAIGTNAFKGCISLTNVTLPNQVRRIRDSAFSGCTGLTSITIPNTVSQIEVAAFSNCSNLTSVYFEGNAPTQLYSSTPFANSDLVTIYYYARTTGWKATFGGRPTATRIDPNASNYQIMPVASFKVSITSYTGSNSVVTIPNTINGMTIIGIGDEAFYMRALLKSVTIPTGVTAIGIRTFAGCSGLTNLSIPNCVASIGNEAFSGCQGIKEITIPASLATIPELAFGNCRGLGSIVIPNGVTNIAEWAFMNCSGITNVTIPDSVLNISGAAFQYCSGLTSITIPSGVTSIRNATFDLCTGLANVIMPNSVTNIESYAFYGCGNLTNLTIPNSVTCIGSSAFFGCSNLTSLAIPDGLTIIENYAFSGCSAMTNIAIPNSVTNIGFEAFKQNRYLTHIIIPSNVVSIGSVAFSGCASLTSITLSGNIAEIGVGAFEDCGSLRTIAVDTNNAAFSSLDGALFNKNQTILIRGPGGSTGTYAIPGSVTNIAAYAFSGCTGLTNISIPTSVTSIGNYAFKGCIGLGGIEIPSTVTAIGSQAFAGCIGLTNEAIPDSVTSIVMYSFEGCTNLTSITVGALNTNYASVDGVVFSKDLKTLILYPPGRMGSYSVPGSVTNIPSAAFGACSGLTNVTIPESVIKLWSLSVCTGLTAIHVDTSNPVYASMDGVVFDKTLTTLIQYPPGRIGSYTIPTGVTNIGNGAFNGCINLTSIVIPESIVGMGYYAFSGCVGLTNITFPNTITNIGDFAFNQCTALTRVTIPGSVIKIGFSAFSDCTALASVFIEGNAPTSNPPLLFDNALNVTVYYRAGTTGWRASYANPPTALWIEQTPFQQWAQTCGLLEMFPNASGETDDADHDGMSNLVEMQAGTDPTTATSALKFERAPRPADLADADKTAVGSEQHALYFQTVPGKQYKIESATAFGVTWQSELNVSATTTQKRVLVTKPLDHRFYRVVLVP